MDFRQLQIFCLAAQTLNFTRTAEQLGYVQSNVTGQIRQLETELQVKLFERFNNRVHLTPEGELLLPRALQIVQLCEQTREEFAGGNIRGVIRIGASETLCVHRLPPLLSAYRNACPAVGIQVTTEHCRRLFQLLRDNSLDLAFLMTNDPPPPDLELTHSRTEPLVMIAGSGHELAASRCVSPQQLAAQCLILTPPECGHRPHSLAVLSACGCVPERRMELSSVAAIKECVACNLGVAILPGFAVIGDLAAGRITELSWQGPPLFIKTHLARHRDKWVSPALRRFIEMTAEA